MHVYTSILQAAMLAGKYIVYSVYTLYIEHMYVLLMFCASVYTYVLCMYDVSFMYELNY